MQHINFNSPKHVHFIGIGGISMSGLAELLLSKGFTVSGSDERFSPITEKLEQNGIDLHIGHKPSNIKSSTELVVYTAAISQDNIELVTARNNNIPTIERSTLLGEIMSNYHYSIGISGTHGKTTTTSMISEITLAAKKDPTIVVGGLLDRINGNIRVGDSKLFIAEACEYSNTFLELHPYIGIILNIDIDHIDFFKNLDNIRKSFHNYAKNINKNGYLVINSCIDQIVDITNDIECNIITIGIDDESDYIATNIKYINNIYPNFDIYYKRNFIGNIQLNVPGNHNIYNALCAIATGRILNIDIEDIKTGLFNFKGTHKRFEFKGDLKGITIIDDYAHHPTEIKVTLETAQKLPHKKIWCVFQPHTYSRTKAFLKDFAKALSYADTVILADIYAAREKNNNDIHSRDLLKELHNIDCESYYFETFDEIENFILENCSPGDLLITMGAGDISIVGTELLGA